MTNDRCSVSQFLTDFDSPINWFFASTQETCAWLPEAEIWVVLAPLSTENAIPDHLTSSTWKTVRIMCSPPDCQTYSSLAKALRATFRYRRARVSNWALLKNVTRDWLQRLIKMKILMENWFVEVNKRNVKTFEGFCIWWWWWESLRYLWAKCCRKKRSIKMKLIIEFHQLTVPTVLILWPNF